MKYEELIDLSDKLDVAGISKRNLAVVLSKDDATELAVTFPDDSIGGFESLRWRKYVNAGIGYKLIHNSFICGMLVMVMEVVK